MDHDRAVLLAVRSHVFRLKALRKLEVELNGSALPGSSQGIRQMEVDLGSVERAVAFIDHIILSGLIQRLTQGLRRQFPILIASHAVFGSGGQLHMIREAETAVDLVDQAHYALDLVLDLLPGHENMRIVLGEAAHAHQAVQLAGLFMTVHQSQLADPKRQVTVGTGLGFVNQHAARAVHGLHRVILVVDHGGVHVFPVMIPVSGGLPELPVQDDGSGDLLIALSVMQSSPVIDQDILQHHSLGKEERESGAFLHDRENAQLLSQFAVIPLLRLLDAVQILLQLLLIREGGSVDPGEHLVLFAASPVGSRQAGELDRLHIFGVVQMRARAQIHELALTVKADHRVLRQILDQLHLVVLVSLLHEGDRLISGKREALQRQTLLHDLLHFLFNGGKILAGDGLLELKIIVEAVLDRRPDRQLRVRIQALYRLSQNVGGGVAEGPRPVLLRKFLFSSASVLQNHIHFCSLLSKLKYP